MYPHKRLPQSLFSQACIRALRYMSQNPFRKPGATPENMARPRGEVGTWSEAQTLTALSEVAGGQDENTAGVSMITTVPIPCVTDPFHVPFMLSRAVAGSAAQVRLRDRGSCLDL